MAVFFFFFKKKVSVFGCATEEGRRKTERDRKRESGGEGTPCMQGCHGRTQNQDRGHIQVDPGSFRASRLRAGYGNEASPGYDFMSILFLTVVLSLSLF